VAIDTSMGGVGVAAARGDEPPAEMFVPGLRAQQALGALEEVLKGVGADRREIKAVVACVGPGFFTGLRVGLALAKGLGVGLGVELVGVGSLEAIAAGLGLGKGRVWVVADARRGLVYAGCYELTGTLPRVLEPDLAATPARLAPLMQPPAIVVGTGARMYWEQLGRQGLELAPAWAELPRPAVLLELGRMRLAEGGAVEPGELKARYCRPSDAEERFGLPLDGYNLLR